MSEDKQQVHRPGALKQVNKTHKHGRHRSKGSLSVSTKGKVSVKVASKKKNAELNREQRRNQANQIRHNKREEMLAKKRNLGGSEAAPFLVCILPLQECIDPNTALSILTQCDSDAIVNKSSTGITHVSIPRFKQRYSFIIPSTDNEFDILDALKISDTVLFLISALGSDIIDAKGQKNLSLCFGQGLPTPILALTDLESINPKRRNEQKQNIQKLVSKQFSDEKLMLLEKYSDAINVLRRIGNQSRKELHFRDNRPNMIAESLEYVPNTEGSSGTLKVTGYLRGTPLSVNKLVHIPGLGDFQMSQIDAPYDPYPLDPKKSKPPTITEDGKIPVQVLERADPSKQESLVSESIPNPMDAEQTWPTEEEIEMADNEQKKVKRKAPKGWSDYQSAWIHEGEDDGMFDDSDEDDDQEDDELMDARSEDDSNASDGEGDVDDNMTESVIAADDQRYDDQLDLAAEEADLAKIKAARVDFEFPDEVDTPIDCTARTRFQKYRYLESFRDSPWDPLENLPLDYSRIFQFKNFNMAKKAVLKKAQEAEPNVFPGMYVTVHVANVPQSSWAAFSSTNPLVALIGMFEHEHQMSLIHTFLKREKSYEEPIKSKERLIFQCGYRRFAVNPIFSEHTNGKKHKFERFFQPESISVATFYAPIQFPPAPVLCYKEVNDKLILVAAGRLLSCMPNRLIVKRVVLTGHPFKVHKRSGVVRFMFFNPEDINYFKTCELRTKYGITGKIKEPLGTHGHMKCVFKKPLKTQDTVKLFLYKRVFPKWTYEDLIVSCPNEKMDD